MKTVAVGKGNVAGGLAAVLTSLSGGPVSKASISGFARLSGWIASSAVQRCTHLT